MNACFYRTNLPETNTGAGFTKIRIPKFENIFSSYMHPLFVIKCEDCGAHDKNLTTDLLTVDYSKWKLNVKKRRPIG